MACKTHSNMKVIHMKSYLAFFLKKLMFVIKTKNLCGVCTYMGAATVMSAGEGAHNDKVHVHVHVHVQSTGQNVPHCDF